MLHSTRIGWLKSSLIGAVMLSASVVAALPTAAATLTGSAADIQAFDLISSTGNPTFTYSNYTSSPTPTVSVTTAWNGNPNNPPVVNGFQTAEVGVTSTSIASVGGDIFKLVIHNTNENPWNFQLVINGVAGALVTIVNGASAVLHADLVGETITSFGVLVSGILPISGYDRTAEFSVSAIPLPPALLLFVSGIAGLSLLGRRRQKKTKFGAMVRP